MPADDFTSCKTKDDPNYDYFVCQFFESLTRYQTTDPNGYWFGRLVGFGFSMNNLIGENFTEDNFREDLENGDIIFHGYTLIEVNYQTEVARLTSTIGVSGKVELDVTINEQRQTITNDFAFTIRQGWMATEVSFS